MKITTDRKVLLIVSATLIVFTLSGGMIGRVAAVEGTYSSLRLFNEALYLIVNNYVQPVDIDALMEGGYRGLLESLDPGNEYLSASAYERASKGETGGAGDVGLTLFKKRGYVVVVAVRPGSAAAEAGMRTGDVLISIEGQSTRQMGVWEAGQLLRGEPGTTVDVVLAGIAGAERRTLSLVRERGSGTPPRGDWVSPDVGVVRIASIEEGDARELGRAIARLKEQGMQRLLLDLRGCASSSLAEAIGMASLFISEGTIVTVADRYEGDKEYQADGRRRAWDGTMALLVDEGTARTCEVLSAALRDVLQVPIVGERTWGIGSQHALLPLGNGDGVILAVGRYLSPSGKDWNAIGIEPDLQIVGDEAGEEDTQRRRAIDYLRGMASADRREAA